LLALTVFELRNARHGRSRSLAIDACATKKRAQTRHSILQQGTPKKKNPKQTQAKTSQKGESDTSERKANTEFAYGDPQLATNATATAATPSRVMTGNWQSGTLAANR
jgi:hypothetical protein